MNDLPDEVPTPKPEPSAAPRPEPGADQQSAPAQEGGAAKPALEGPQVPATQVQAVPPPEMQGPQLPELEGPPAPDGGVPDKRRRRRRRRRKPGAEDADVAKAPGGEEAAAVEGREPVAAAPRKKKRKRKPRERPDQPAARPPKTGERRGPRRPENLGTVAVKALSEMARALLDAEGVDPFSRPRWLDLKLRVPLDPGRDAARSAGEAVRQLVERVEEVRQHESALRPGSVYCYFTDSADAPASRPQKPREVFDGFGSTGRPVFTDFVTLGIERRDAGIDELVNGEEIVVTHVSMGRVLRTQQLQEFGAESPVYRILGQVDAGLYPMMGSDQKAAFSFQLLKGTTLDGTPRFRLHWVGAADVRDIADPGVGAILKRFQLQLDRESLRFAGMGQNGSAPDEEEFVLPLLQELSKRLAGRARRAGRRTEHATQRADERVRPTAKVWDDAKAAGDDRILRDDEQGTIVVVGPKNRVHVFSFDAKHVTSFVMTGGQVHNRCAEGRWHPAEPEERGEFRIALKRRLSAGEDQVED